MKTRVRVALFGSLLLAFAFSAVHFAPTVGASATGQIVGTVKLDGQAPHQKPIDMSKDPACAQAGGGPISAENVVVGANGGLVNVVVYISQGLTGNEASTSSQPATITQKGCKYVPHVLALNVGQHMTVMNDDKTAHNIHPQPNVTGGNSQWNKSQTAGAGPIDVAWTNEEVAIPVKCNIHPWMRAYIAVVKGPFGVSNDTGSFKLDNVPPGTYTLTAWQETYGTQTQKVTVAAGKPASTDFTFKAK
ncbi:MAG TPA: carboxypeptidase regulatory-like domain-containing protein [Terriglobales bacterium]|jgi:plastocyanin|nr:carboxypeptidase regulatory-like domain-containing protein [Terriglobales bacterium]